MLYYYRRILFASVVLCKKTKTNKNPRRFLWKSVYALSQSDTSCAETTFGGSCVSGVGNHQQQQQQQCCRCVTPLVFLCHSGNRRCGLGGVAVKAQREATRWWCNLVHPQVAMSECPERSSRISLLKEPLLRRLCEVLDRCGNRGWRKLGEIVSRDRRFRVRWAQVTHWLTDFKLWLQNQLLGVIIYRTKSWCYSNLI